MVDFANVAIPHRDIYEGRFTLDVYASDLWDVVKGVAPEEYRDRELFFLRTYETDGLRQIVSQAEARLKGEPADPVVQLQTPFGGGKTHTLIYLYHKAKEWKANVFVFCGDKISARDSTLWEEMERQLSGRVERFKGEIAPGGEKIKEFLTHFEPLLILMDEVHAYLVSAQAIRVGDSNLADQSLLFIQTLTNVIKSMEKTAMYVSLPSSSPYSGEEANKLLANLKHIVGRVERVYTPITDEEVASVIRKRLFSKVDEEKAKRIVNEFIEFSEREKILPQGVEKSHYRERFLKSYPFQPELIDVLYQRWGSFPEFQRTRGVLRLLALVVHSLIGKNRPFIRLADFDLSNESIRRELVKHIGSEYDSIIAQDITSETSGAKKVDKALGDSYRPYYFGTKVATTIFMYSFSGAGEKGTTKNEIKLSASEPSVGSSIIVETIDKLKETLFYLDEENLYFKNRPNLNKVLIDKIENISEEKIEEVEMDLLKKELKGDFENYIWPKNSKDVPDSPKLKLIVLRRVNGMNEIYEKYGERPRIYKNTLLFVVADSNERPRFEEVLKKKFAWEAIDKDSTLSLTEAQKREVKEKIKRFEEQIRSALRNLYRKVFLPAKDELKEIDLGIATYGKDRSLDKELYERLKSEGEILSNLSPKVLIDKYLKDSEYVKTKEIYETFLKVPGEPRIYSEDILKSAIEKGVKEGIFGLGILEENKILCKYYKEDCEVSLEEDEIIIKKEICEEELKKERYEKEELQTYRETDEIVLEPVSEAVRSFEESIAPKQLDLFSSLKLDLEMPSGKFSDFVSTERFLKTKFKNIKIRISIEASDGAISKFEYEDKIKEAFLQSGIKVLKEDLK